MAVYDAGFRQLANTLAETGLLGTTMPVVVARTIDRGPLALQRSPKPGNWSDQ